MKKIIAILLSLIMVLSIMGCQDNNDNNQEANNNNNTNSNETTNDNQDTNNSNNEQNDNLDEPYELSWLTYFPADQNTQLYLETIEKLEELCNVKIDIESAPSANYGERIQLTLASSKLPDAIIFNSTEDPLIKSSVEAGTFIAVNEYLENSPSLNEYISPIGFDALKYMGDDQIYGIPRHTFVRADGFSIRTDWLENINVTIEPGKPITLDKFTEIIKKFTDEDPDRNGSDDTYGVTVNSSADGAMFDIYAKDTFSGIMQGIFGLVGWQKYDDEDYEYMNLVFSKKADNFKRLLQYLQDLYTGGYVDPDWPVLKRDQAEENFLQGKYGLSVRFPLHVPTVNTNLKKVNPEANITWVSGVINPDENKVMGTSFSNACWGVWQITSSSENPAKVVQVFDQILADGFYTEQVIYGGEGRGYNVVNGKKEPTDLYLDPDEGTGNSNRILRRYGDPSVYLNLGFSQEELNTYENWLEEAVSNAVLSESLGFVPPVATTPQYLDYQKDMNQIITQIIIGEAEVEAYDEVLDGWYENGGTEYVEQMNDYIKSIK